MKTFNPFLSIVNNCMENENVGNQKKFTNDQNFGDKIIYGDRKRLQLEMLAIQTLATEKSMTIEKNDDRNCGDRKNCGNKRI